MSEINIGKYYNTNSELHNMDSFYKIICLIVFATTLFLTQNIFIILILYLFIISLIIISNIEFSLYMKNLKTIVILSIFILVINIIFKIPIIDTIIQISKLVLIITYSSIIMYTTTTNDITVGIEKTLSIFKKTKIDIKKLSLIISLTIRFIPIIIDQAKKVFKSQTSRGLNFNEENIINKMKALNSIILPIFMLSFKRADEIADYMELRLYDSNKEVESPRILKNSFDNLMLLSHAFLFIINIFMR